MSTSRACYIYACIMFLLALVSGITSFGQSGDLTLGKSFEIQSTQLSETRTVNVYLPEGYNEKDTARYPVIYLLDGGMDEDFHHITGLVQYSSQPWVGGVPRSIVVGIVNVDRKRDFTYPTTIEGDKDLLPTSGGSAKFISFIEEELQPFITSKFRTNNSRILIGESLGALLATEILFTKPYLFDKYIIVSPSLWWGDGLLLNTVFKQPQHKTDIYIGVGKEGLTPSKKPRVMETDAKLLKEKIEKCHYKNVSVRFDYFPNESHATISHIAVYNALKKLYPNKKKK